MILWMLSRLAQRCLSPMRLSRPIVPSRFSTNFNLQSHGVAHSVRRLLEDDVERVDQHASLHAPPLSGDSIVENVVIGNNQVAVDAAAQYARMKGYRVVLGGGDPRGPDCGTGWPQPR